MSAKSVKHCIFPSLDNSPQVNLFKDVVWECHIRRGRIDIAFGIDRKAFLQVKRPDIAGDAEWLGDSLVVECKTGKPVVLCARNNALIIDAEKGEVVIGKSCQARLAGREIAFEQRDLMQFNEKHARATMGKRRFFRVGFSRRNGVLARKKSDGEVQIKVNGARLAIVVSQWKISWNTAGGKADRLRPSLAEALEADPQALLGKAREHLSGLPQVSFSKPVDALWSSLDKLHRISIYPADGFFKRPWESIGKGDFYQRRIMGHWDTCYIAMDLLWIEPQRAGQEFETYMDGLRPSDGMMPLDCHPEGPYFIVSHPPMLAPTAWQLYLGLRNKRMLKRSLSILRRNIRWWEQNRDRDGDGLFEYEDTIAELWESGVDQCPRWYDEQGRKTQSPNPCIDLSCQMVITYDHAAKIARELGNETVEKENRARAKALRERIRKQMYDPETGFFYDVRGDEFVRVKSMAGFWTLLAGVATRTQAKSLVKALDDPAQFMTAFPLPYLARSEKTYDWRKYWHAVVFISQNLMVVQGLRRYGYAELAAKIARRCLDMAGRIALERERIYEYYLPDNAASPEKSWGDPERTISDPYYTGHMPLRPMLLEGIYGMTPDLAGVSFKPVWPYLPKESFVEFVLFGKRMRLVCRKTGSNSGRTRIEGEDGRTIARSKIRFEYNI